MFNTKYLRLRRRIQNLRREPDTPERHAELLRLHVKLFSACRVSTRDSRIGRKPARFPKKSNRNRREKKVADRIRRMFLRDFHYYYFFHESYCNYTVSSNDSTRKPLPNTDWRLAKKIWETRIPPIVLFLEIGIDTNHEYDIMVP